MASIRRRRYEEQEAPTANDYYDEEEDEEEEEEEEDDDEDYGSEDGTTPDSSSSSPAPYDMELHSMTAKGIKHVCSELLEINKASEEDFRRNVHLSYLSFVRLFEEAGDLGKDVARLRRHALEQRRLVQDLTNNLYSSIAAALSSGNPKEEEAIIDANAAVVVDALDVLLCEHRLDEAMELLEQEGRDLEKLQSEGHPARLVASRMSALSARRARIADRLAALADDPRTPRHELLRALSGLRRLGDAQRATRLLFKSHRAAVIRRVDELRRSNSYQRNYIKELARTVFASVVDASRGFVALHGRPSAELLRFAREEMEDFSTAFHEYVGSMADAGEGLVLALEAARCAFSYCAMLRPLGMALEEDLVGLIRPCMEEAMGMYAKHLKEVIRLFVSSESWVLGRFIMSGIRRSPTRSAAIAGSELEHCLLTTSGRKLVTLIQEVVEDVSPLLHLGMKNSALQLLAGLFREYMHSIVEVIPNKEASPDDQQQYMWQLSVLINCTTLVSLFPVIANGIFDSKEASSQAAQRELEGLILVIKETSGQVWTEFCQQFIQDTMSSLQNKPTASFAEGTCAASSPQGVAMPSFAFQVLFLRLRKLSNLYGAILTSKDGTMKRLLQELMEGMVMWLHDNVDSWIHHAQDVAKDTPFYQIQLDVHFLLEIAQVGGFSSANIRTTALDLLKKAEGKVSSLEQSMVRSDISATDAAKHAIEVLMLAEANSSSSQEEASVNTEEEMLNAGEIDDIARDAQEGEETDNEIDNSAEMSDSWSNEHASSLALDDDGCDSKSTDDFISIEINGGAAEGSTEDDMSLENISGRTFQVLGSGNGGDDTISNRKLLKDTTMDVREDTARASEAHGLPDASLTGLGGSEIHDATTEATASPQDQAGQDDSSCSFTTPPEELLQDTPIPVVRDGAEETAADAMSMSSMEGTDQQSDAGSWRRRRSTPAAAEKGTGSSRKKREATSRSSRPRWQ